MKFQQRASGVFAYQNASLALLTSTDAVVPFQVELFDDNLFHDNVTNNSRITFLTAGRYHFGTNIPIDVTTPFTVRIRLNGSTIIARSSSYSTSTYNCANSVSGIYDFSANDYIEVWVVTNVGANTAGTSEVNFWAFKI